MIVASSFSEAPSIRMNRAQEPDSVSMSAILHRLALYWVLFVVDQNCPFCPFPFSFSKLIVLPFTFLPFAVLTVLPFCYFGFTVLHFTVSIFTGRFVVLPFCLFPFCRFAVAFHRFAVPVLPFWRILC